MSERRWTIYVCPECEHADSTPPAPGCKWDCHSCGRSSEKVPPVTVAPVEEVESLAASATAEEGQGQAGVHRPASPSPAKEAFAEFLRGGYGKDAEAALLRYADAKQAEIEAAEQRAERAEQDLQETLDLRNRSDDDACRYREALEKARHHINGGRVDSANRVIRAALDEGKIEDWLGRRLAEHGENA